MAHLDDCRARDHRDDDLWKMTETRFDTAGGRRYRRRRGCGRHGETRAMAKTARGPQKPPNRRGSPEAIEKRRIGRLFNDVLSGRGAGPNRRDGRTEKRRQRLMRELESGKVRGAREMKPLDVLQRVNELMELGEPLSSIRKVAKTRKHQIPAAAMVELVTRLHKAYGFRAECYRFVGVGDDVLRSAGVLPSEAGKRAARRVRAA
jgi:hypothetical protein